MLCSGMLHWLLSQVLFLRRLEIRDRAGVFVSSSSMCAVGYSSVSLLVFVLVVLTCAIAVHLIVLQVGVYGIMPESVNERLVLSAACHPPASDIDVHLKAIKWGALVSQKTGTGVRHCCFTSREVEEVTKGRYYA